MQIAGILIRRPAAPPFQGWNYGGVFFPGLGPWAFLQRPVRARHCLNRRNQAERRYVPRVKRSMIE